MKYGLNILKVITILLAFIFIAGFLWASPDVAAQLRLYEGFKQKVAAPTKVTTSYYLKPIQEKDVFLEVDISKEKASLKRVFNLKDIKLITQAGMVLENKSAGSPFQVIVLNGRKLLLQLSTIEKEKNRFKVEVLEKGKQSRSLMETKIYLPEKKTTVLGFEDSAGKIYFLSFHRGKDVPPPPAPPEAPTAPEPPEPAKHKDKAIDLKGIAKPRLIKSVQPIYPKAAVKAAVQGVVLIDALTDEKGHVKEAHATEGPEALRTAALEAVKQWQYEPYYLDGKAKPVRFTVMVKFNLDKKKKEQKPLNLSIDQKPKLIKKVNPQYPKEAVKAHIEGKVVVEAVTDVKGGVVDVKVVDGPPELRQAAIDAIKQWQYEPYIIDGTAKPVAFTVILNFRLDKKEKEKSTDKPLKLPGDQKPKLIKRVNPKYPKEAIKAGVVGVVVLQATTNTKGRVQDIKVIEGHEMLNQAAIEALKQWQYEPYYVEGEPKPVKFTVKMKFNLNDKKKKEEN